MQKVSYYIVSKKTQLEFIKNILSNQTFGVISFSEFSISNSLNGINSYIQYSLIVKNNVANMVMLELFINELNRQSDVVQYRYNKQFAVNEYINSIENNLDMTIGIEAYIPNEKFILKK